MDLHGLSIEPLLGDLLGELGPSPFAIAVAQPDAATSGFRDSHVIHPTHTVPMPYLVTQRLPFAVESFTLTY